MAVKNTNFGGTDWSAGDVLTALDLNDTFDAVSGSLTSTNTRIDNATLQCEEYTGYSGSTTTSATAINVGTFTVGSENAYLLSLTMAFIIKTSSGASSSKAQVYMTLSGATLGSHFIHSVRLTQDICGGDGYWAYSPMILNPEQAATRDIRYFESTDTVDDGEYHVINVSPNLVLPDGTTNVDFNMRNPGGAISTIGSIVVKAVYVRGFDSI